MTDKMDPRHIPAVHMRAYRESFGLTYTALSQRLREIGVVISPRRLKRMEEESCTIYVRDLLALAEVYHVSASDFVLRL